MLSGRLMLESESSRSAGGSWNGTPVSTPTVSVVLATRNRPEHARLCWASILENQGMLELIVVDQSDGGATEEALSSLTDPRLRYVRTAARGVTSGRNLGIESSRGDVVAFTDDDCRVPRDWVERLTRIFGADPDAAVVCGRVRVPPEIWNGGYASSFEPRERVWQGRFPPPNSDWGITSNLSVRRPVLASVGVFDPVLGAGAPLLSGGETDFLFRVLKAGRKVVNASEVEVDHLGVRRPGAETRDLIRGYGVGISAALMKHVRLGDAGAIRLYLRWLGWLVRVVASNLVRGRRPLGVGFALSFLAGARASFRFRIDRVRRLYVPT